MSVTKGLSLQTPVTHKGALRASFLALPEIKNGLNWQ